MNEKLYAIYDTKARAISGGIMRFRHDTVAIRWFSDGFYAEHSIIARHPEDFALFCLGELAQPDNNPNTRPHLIAGDCEESIEQPTTIIARLVLTGESCFANLQAAAKAHSDREEKTNSIQRVK